MDEPAPAFEGKYTPFGAVKFEPKPVQEPLPIWVGGHSRAALRRTVAFGAAWHPINRPPGRAAGGTGKAARLAGRRGGPPRRHHAAQRRPRAPVRRVRAGSAHAGPGDGGEPSALVDQIGVAACGVEHLVLEFLSEDGRALDEQMEAFVFGT